MRDQRATPEPHGSPVPGTLRVKQGRLLFEAEGPPDKVLIATISHDVRVLVIVLAVLLLGGSGAAALMHWL